MLGSLSSVQSADWLGGLSVLWVISGIILCIVCLLLLPLSLVVRVAYEWPTFQFSLTLHFLRYIQHTFRSGKPDSNTVHPAEEQGSLEPVNQPGILAQVDRLIELLPDVKSRVTAFRMKSFYWDSTIGVGDAAHTAVISGFVWTVKGMIMGILTDWFLFDCEPDLTVTPCYSGLALTTEARCILRCPLGKTMWAGWRLYRLLRSQKARDAHASGRASDSIPDADSDGELEGNGGRQHDYRRSG